MTILLSTDFSGDAVGVYPDQNQNWGASRSGPAGKLSRMTLAIVDAYHPGGGKAVELVVNSDGSTDVYRMELSGGGANVLSPVQGNNNYIPNGAERYFSFAVMAGPETDFSAVGDVETIWQCHIGQYATATLTFTAALTAATSGTLTNPWKAATGNYTFTFSDNSTRSVALVYGATTATWTGAVTGTATFTVPLPSSQPPITIEVEGGFLYMSQRYNSTSDDYVTYADVARHCLGRIVPGVWTRFVVRLRLRHTNVSAGLTFTAALAAATSGTLAAAWAQPSGQYPVTFSDGTIKNVLLTNGDTTATWTGTVTSTANTMVGINPITQVWRDDRMVYDNQSSPNNYNRSVSGDAGLCYFKFGCYMPGRSVGTPPASGTPRAKRSWYFAKIKIGDYLESFASMNPTLGSDAKPAMLKASNLL